MKIFKSYAYKWWQIGIFELALLGIGIIVGAYWNSFFSAYLVHLVVIATISSIYVWYLTCKQVK